MTIGPLASTKMYCMIEPAEHTVSQTIESAKKWKVEGNDLSLLDDNGNVLAQLTRA